MQDKELKTIEIAGSAFRIVKMTPLDANWLFKSVVTRGIPIVIEQLGAGVTMEDISEGRVQIDLFKVVPLLLDRLKREEFEEVQVVCLSACRKVDGNGIGLPVYDRVQNRFTFDNIENPTFLSLVIASMVQNITPFFSAGALKGLVQSFLGSRPPSPTT